MIFYFRYEKARLDRQRIVEASKGVGKPKVGGPFELLDQEGKTFTQEDMKGGYSLVSEVEVHMCLDELRDQESHLRLYGKCFETSESALAVCEALGEVG